MKILDDVKKIKKLDSKNMLGSLESLYYQIEEVFEIAKKMKLSGEYKKANRILVMGMGGSALGAHIIKTFNFDSLKLPLEIINGYHLPAYADKNTLVICSSYSGSTEEILNSAAEAKKKKTKLLIICSGGKLGEFAKLNKIPALIFTTNNNPCGSPRMGLGYSIFGQLLLFDKIGLIKFGKKEIDEVLQVIKTSDSRFGVNVSSANNPAKRLAEEVFGKSVWFVGAEHLIGNAHVAGNQMNENAKRFSGYFAIPELNHHLLEGMIYPKTNKSNLAFLLFTSNFYDLRVQKRFIITADVLNKNKIKNITYDCYLKTKLGQVCEVLVLGSYLSYYCGILQGIDPTAIPFVDYFKERLKK